ncbi:VIT1/CCC1 transporter family protein [Mucilaginibacter sp. UYCu711]|uniref:VIT1/CCC1 transporter family protein n=1 Tax=Mucilaginibacter sp. UYCu711 TaxID=3156339 RepID=UPI003D24DD75
MEKHYTNRSGWLRAAVLGANDGILSTTSIAIGVAAASIARQPIILAAVAGLAAGAMSMAAGEYVSVSSQSDIETADIAREKHELDTMAEIELKELAKIYQKRGLKKDLAMEVAVQLTAYDALEAHARDELGINEMTQAKPLTAALASALSFITGGFLPLLVSIFAPLKFMLMAQYGFAIFFLATSAMVAAKAGGSNISKAVLRICFWGTVAMAMTALVGYIFGVKTS